MAGIIRAPRPPRGWTELPNTTIRDKRLSYRARGVLARLLSNEDGYRMTAEDLAAEAPEGRTAVLSALKELRQAGYVVVIRIQGPGGRWRTETIVFDNPQPPSEVRLTEVGKPDVGCPAVGCPAVGSPDRLKKDQQNKKKKEQQKEEAESKPAPLAPAATEELEHLNPHAARSCPSGAPVAQGDDAALAQRIEQLRKAGLKAGDDGRDAAKLQQLADFGRYAGAAAVLSVISSAGLPGQALKACQDAGLGKAAAKAKAQAEAAEASARLAQQLAEGRKREEAYHSLIRQAYRQGAAHA